MSLIIFTDLDGTLLNADDYRYEAAIPVLEKLKSKQIPVIPVTSKTRQEVETLREEIKLDDPFIVENGSAIFIPFDSKQFEVDASDRQENYFIELLGCTYDRAREGLKEISKILGEDLRGFGDLSETEIEQLTGLSLIEVRRAKAREFSEPFITPKNISPDNLKLVEAQGFRVVVGDRFSHLIGVGSGKGKAVQWLKEHYRSDGNLLTVGLGNSPNDLDMLEVVDFPMIIPGDRGSHPGLAGRGWQVASAPGANGWASSVTKLLGTRLLGISKSQKKGTGNRWKKEKFKI